MTAPRYSFDANGAPVRLTCIRCGAEAEALADDLGVDPDECAACYLAEVERFNRAADALFLAPARAIFSAALAALAPGGAKK